jgi:hypothetical protein
VCLFRRFFDLDRTNWQKKKADRIILQIAYNCVATEIEMRISGIWPINYVGSFCCVVSKADKRNCDQCELVLCMSGRGSNQSKDP